jgi:ATP-binding cassette, subfamily B, bacterial
VRSGGPDSGARSRRAASRTLVTALGLPWRCAPFLAMVQFTAMIVTGLIPVAAADLTAALIDRLGAARPGTTAAAGWLTVAIVAVTAGGALLQHTNRYASRELTRRIGVRTQHELYEAALARDGLAQLEDPAFHNRIRLAQQAASAGPQQLVTTVLGIVQSAITTGGFLVSLASFAPTPAALLVASAVPSVLAQRRLTRMRARTTADSAPFFRRQLFYAQLLLDLRAAKEIRLFGLGPRLLRRMQDETRAAQRLDRAVDRATLRTDALLSLLTAAMSGAALAVVVDDVAQGRAPVGALAVLIAALAGVQNGIAGIVGLLANLSQTLILFGYFTDLVGRAADRGLPELPPGGGAEAGAGAEGKDEGGGAPNPDCGTGRDTGGDSPRTSPASGIRFESVWFRYHDATPWVLSDLTLHLPPGTVVGLVGLNGAGKSTLAKLLCRLYEPTRGRITWDGVDLRDLPVDELRARISAVFQDFMTYELTAHDNVAVGAAPPKPGDRALPDHGPGLGVPREAVVAAASASGAHELLSALPNGYDSMLSRTFADDAALTPSARRPGVLLSGGQWQRVALARAAMRADAELVVLDEPAANLDPQSEAALRDRLDELLVGKIGVLISHRLDGVRRAGLIVVLKDGTAAEQGTHDELLERGGEYARLFLLQARGYREVASARD